MVMLFEIWGDGMGIEDQFVVGGGESVYIVFNFDDLMFIYVIIINGILIEYNCDIGFICFIMFYFEYVFGCNVRD